MILLHILRYFMWAPNLLHSLHCEGCSSIRGPMILITSGKNNYHGAPGNLFCIVNVSGAPHFFVQTKNNYNGARIVFPIVKDAGASLF